VTTGDEEAENLVDNLFREVDDQFKDLEREYHQAREELATADDVRRETAADPIEASTDRFEMLSQIASLKADISRMADELDERDRLLAELGETTAGFEVELARRDEILKELHDAKQQILDERREQARLTSLLEARAAERTELAAVASRLQNERDHVQQLLTTAVTRFDEVDAKRIQMDDKLRHLEAARDTAASEHDSRSGELAESRAKVNKLVEEVSDHRRDAEEASARANKAEALAERRLHESGYLNRRIDAMSQKIAEAEVTAEQLAAAKRELQAAERNASDSERQIDTLKGEAAAAQAAVEAIAERTSGYDELVAKVEQLSTQRNDVSPGALSPAGSGAAVFEAHGSAAPPAVAEEAVSLSDRAREMGSRRSVQVQATGSTVEPAIASIESLPAPPVAPATNVTADAELQDLNADDVSAIEADLANLTAIATADETEVAPRAEPLVDTNPQTEPESLLHLPPPPPPPPPVPATTDNAESLLAPSFAASPTPEVLPRVALASSEPAPPFESAPLPEPPAAAEQRDSTAMPVADLEVADLEVAAQYSTQPPAPAPASVAEAASAAEAAALATPLAAVEPPAVEVPAISVPPPAGSETAIAAVAAPAIGTAASPELLAGATRKRAILPADLEPNTPEAVMYLLNQPGVSAIVDARSTCGQTGIRPSELFAKIAQLRDRFDVPVEVVVTPVSTPVGGAPNLTAIGVHHVTGADTVADRIRAICMGFPADQPLVVIAGDDHVRRAAIAEEANVIEPASVLNIATA